VSALALPCARSAIARSSSSGALALFRSWKARLTTCTSPTGVVVAQPAQASARVITAAAF